MTELGANFGVCSRGITSSLTVGIGDRIWRINKKSGTQDECSGEFRIQPRLRIED